MGQTTARVYSCEPIAEDEEDEEDRDIAGFRVIFSYSVGGEHFSGEFFSSHEMAKNQTFKLSYDSEHPERNEHTLADDEDISLILKITLGVVVACIVIAGLLYLFLK
jgi:hypothetical protein